MNPATALYLLLVTASAAFIGWEIIAAIRDTRRDR